MQRNDQPVLLVLDDDQEIVDVICTIGAQAGFRPVGSAATTPKELQTALAASRPDVIGGLEFARRADRDNRPAV